MEVIIQIFVLAGIIAIVAMFAFTIGMTASYRHAISSGRIEHRGSTYIVQRRDIPRAVGATEEVIGEMINAGKFDAHIARAIARNEKRRSAS